jgi:hypothetical protein
MGQSYTVAVHGLPARMYDVARGEVGDRRLYQLQLYHVDGVEMMDGASDFDDDC